MNQITQGQVAIRGNEAWKADAQASFQRSNFTVVEYASLSIIDPFTRFGVRFDLDTFRRIASSNSLLVTPWTHAEIPYLSAIDKIITAVNSTRIPFGLILVKTPDFAVRFPSGIDQRFVTTIDLSSGPAAIDTIGSKASQLLQTVKANLRG